MNILGKLYTFLLSLSMLVLPMQTLFGIDEKQVEKLGNFLDNAFANMTEEEKEMFMQEVQREQDMLMKMTPEERAAREEQVAYELDQLISSQPEWFENSKQPMEEPKVMPTNSSDENTKAKSAEPVKTTSSQNKHSKPKTPNVSKSDKEKNKQVIEKINQGIDSLQLKTNNMLEVQHSSWNKNKWEKLKADLKLLKSELLTTVNSDKILAELVKDERTSLRKDLVEFAEIITSQNSKLKTPDAMGLVVVFEGKPKVINQDEYSNAVKSLKDIVDTLSKNLNSNDLPARVNGINEKFTPEKKRTVISKPSKSAPAKTESNINKCANQKDKKLILQDIEKHAIEVNRCLNDELLSITNKYQLAPSNSMKRKLQWKLSELELHLSQLASAVKSIPDCKTEVRSAIQKTVDSNKLKSISESLNSKKLDQETLNSIAEQIKNHTQIILI